jgi:hypothetical protein
LRLPLNHIPLARIVRAVETVRLRLEWLSQRMIPPHFALLHEFSGARTAQAVCAAAELGIADVLVNGARTVEQIARLVHAHPDAIDRSMRLLSSRGIFKRTKDGYALTPMAEALRTDSPISMRAMARLTGSKEHWEHWGHFVEVVRTGEPFVPKLRGMSFFDYIGTKPELAAVFNDAMTSVSNLAIQPTMLAYDFSRFETVADIGGGHGSFLAAILKQAPKARGLLFDLPDVVASAEPMLRAAGVLSRCEIRGGSFFDGVPKGFDAYVMKTVVHDWPHAEALRILRSVRAAIPPHGTLLLVEMVLPDDDSQHPGKLLDLDMMLTNGGRERTAAEYRRVLGEAGFRLVRAVPTMAPFTLVEAKPVARGVSCAGEANKSVSNPGARRLKVKTKPAL